jgi:hypothetical protein
MTRRLAEPLPATEEAAAAERRPARAPSDALPTGGLWTTAERRCILGVDALGLALVLAGAWDASGTRELTSQAPGVTLAVAGCGLALVGHSFAYRRARGRVRAALAVIVGRRTSRRGTPAPVVASADGSTVLVAGPGMGLYHGSHCPFVADKATNQDSRSGHEAAGLKPCAVCLP